MDEVSFLKNFDKLGVVAEKILGDFYPKNSEILIKIHFGEPGNKAAFTPEDIKPIANCLKSHGHQLTLTDTPVSYSSPRNTVLGYEKVAKNKGFAKLGKILISNEGAEVKTKDFTAIVAKPLLISKNVLVISHVKGHSCAGFGGAIKNLGMGGVTKETKAVIHGLAKPVFVKECRGCGTCVRFCPSKAIRTLKKIHLAIGKKIIINHQACWGCSICEIECPYHCLVPKKAIFDDLLAQSASAVIKKLPQKTFYINFLKRIVFNCDCETNPGETLSPDIGVLFSENPVAIDKASIDLINEVTGKNLFKETHHKDPLVHVNFASKYSGLEMEYKLV